MTSKALFSFTLLALAAASTACARLDPIDENVCGNRVVEPENGEDCDGTDNCGLPGSGEGACLFACSRDVDAPVACPAGFGCGLDGVCRQPTGRLEVVAEVGASALVLQAADLDGDGRDDLFRTGSDATVSQFFDADFRVTTSTTISRAPGDVAPLLAELTFDDEGAGDGRVDVGLAVELGENASGLSIYRSQADRSFAPTAYATLALNGTYAFGVAVRAFPPFNQDQVLTFVATAGTGMLVGIRNDNPAPSIIKTGTTPVNPESLTGAATGNLVTGLDSPCDELIWTAARVGGADRKIFLYEPCKSPSGPPSAEWSDADGAIQAIDTPSPLFDYKGFAALGELPNYYTNVFVTDVDDDGLDDIVAVLLDGDGIEKPVFYLPNDGDGDWSNNGPWIQMTDVALNRGVDDAGVKVVLASCDDYSDDPPDPGELVSLGIPLAIRDLNRDGVVDFVTDDSVWISRETFPGSTEVTYDLVGSCLEWGRVVIGDFDRNGEPDIAAARTFDAGIDVVTSAGDGSFTWNVIGTRRAVYFVSAGDYDGDFVTDLSYLELDVEADPGEPTDTLSVAFGRTSGGFDAPVSLGTLRRARGLVTGRFEGGDATSDILVGAQNKKGDLSVALFSGDGARQIVSPFLLQRRLAPPLGFADTTALAAGRFSLDTPQGLAAMTSFGPDLFPIGVLWALHVDDEAELGGDEKSGTLVEFCDACALAPLDLDDDGQHELVVFGTEAARIYTRRSGANAPFEAIGDVDGLSGLVFFSSLFTRPLVRDFDGDGRDDVALLAARIEGSGDEVLTGFEVIVFWNDGSGSLALARTTRVLLGEIESGIPPGVVALELDVDPALELVVGLTRSGFDLAEGELRVFHVVPDQAELSFEEGVLLPTLDESALYGAISMAAGDFNGDGVHDLALSGYDFYTVLRGVPVR